MNTMKSNVKLIAMGCLLAFGLFACKSSKKAADASGPTNPPEETVTVAETPAPEPADEEPAMSEEEALNLKLGNYFNAIASSGSATAANRSINEAKNLFASADVPVFIIIHESADGQKDYDEPTTIVKYMNYLKDQGKNLNKIYQMKTNNSGKITELELIRK